LRGNTKQRSRNQIAATHVTAPVKTGASANPKSRLKAAAS